MTKFSIILLWLVYWKISRAVTTEKTVFVMKQFLDSREHIVIGAKHFKDLLRGNIFIDRSLLVAEILENSYDLMVITAPPKWGKTVNLKMMENFLEIEVDKNGKQIPQNETANYRLFQHGQIVFRNGTVQHLITSLLISSRTDIMRKYQGQYPVIYVNMKEVTGNNWNSIVQKFKESISFAFERHEYLDAMFNSVDNNQNTTAKQKENAKKCRELFRRILYQRVSDEEVPNSLLFLSQLLFQYFNKKVFIFLDGYDEVFNNSLSNCAFQSTDEETLIEFYQNFIHQTFRNNSYLEKGILTGTLSITKGQLIPVLNNVLEHNILDFKLHEFFSFDEREANVIYDYLNMNPEIRNSYVIRFLQYKVLKKSQARRYDPWDLLNFLFRGKETVPDRIKFIQRYFPVFSFRRAMMCLASGLNLPSIGFNNVYFDRNDFQLLKEPPLDFNRSASFTLSALKYLYSVGVVTSCNMSTQDSIFLKLSTERFYFFMNIELKRYHEDILKPRGFTFDDYKEISQVFTEFAVNEQRESVCMNLLVLKFLTGIFGIQGQYTPLSNYTVHLAIDYLCTRFKQFGRLACFTSNIALLSYQASGILIDVTLNEPSAKAAMERAKIGAVLFKNFNSLRGIKFIGIHVRKPGSKTANLTAEVIAEWKPFNELFSAKNISKSMS